MRLLELLIVVSSFVTLAHSIPVFTFPLNSQFPPVARVSKTFSYIFPTSTFSSDLPITYTLSNSPDWLLLDGSTYTLHGTPSAEDVGEDTETTVIFGLTATDDSGSTTLSATLIISKDLEPILAIPFSQQSFASSSFSAPQTVLYHPSTPFTFTFDPNTFTNGDSSTILAYYAVSSNNTHTATFMDIPPQTWGVQLIASDVQAFTGISLFFDVEVGVHLLAFTDTQIVIDATAGQELNYNSLLKTLQLDGNPITRSSIASISATALSWLTMDNTTLAITGTVPTDFTSSNLTVQVTDIYGDIAESLVMINLATDIFISPHGVLNVTADKSFSYDLGLLVYNKFDVIMEVLSKPDWISFNTSSFLLTGDVPSSAKASTTVLSLYAYSKSQQINSTEAYDLSISPGVLTASPSSTSSAHTTQTSAGETPTVDPAISSTQHSSHPNKKLLLGILIPVGVALAAIFVALLCCWRNRRRAAKDKNYAGFKHEISAPMDVKPTNIAEILGIESMPHKTIEHLKLDMTGFSEPRHTAILPNQPTEPLIATNRRIKADRRQTIRRSQTVSVTTDAQFQKRISVLSETRGRAYSENALFDAALSRTENESRVSRNSAFLTETSRTNSTNTRRLSRTYSNYSRKGHMRRSFIMPSSSIATVMDESTMPSNPKSPDSLLNLRDNTFASQPLNYFSVIPTNTGHNITPLSQTFSEMQPNTKHSSTHMRNTGKSESSLSARRHSWHKAVLIGRAPSSFHAHGGRGSMASTTTSMVSPFKHRSIGHGQDWGSPSGISTPDSSNWVTIGVSGLKSNHKRLSTKSTSSIYSNAKDSPIAPSRIIRRVAASPNLIPITNLRSVSDTTATSRHSRPVSRAIESSPFFAGSRRSTKKILIRTSYADSPTVPEGTAVFMVQEKCKSLRDVREESLGVRSRKESKMSRSRESGGVTYGAAQEGTRQLRTFIKSRIMRGRSRNSMASLGEKRRVADEDENDSRFASAAEIGAGIGVERERLREQEERPMTFDDYVVEPEHSESSWETQLEDGASEASELNLHRYSDKILPRPSPGFASLNRQPSTRSLPSSLFMGSPMTGVKMGGGREVGERKEESPQARFRDGTGQRPISVDARRFTEGTGRDVGRMTRVQRSVMGEMYFAAYI